MKDNRAEQILKSFNPNFIIKDWCNTMVISAEEIELFKFYNKEVSLGNQKVALKDVIGTTHSSYNGKGPFSEPCTWIEFIGRLKRFKEGYYTADEFIKYFNSEKFYKNHNSEPIFYSKYGDKYIIDGGGNNRTVQAKFCDIEYIIAKVEEWILDKEMLEIYEKLQVERLFPKIGGEIKGKDVYRYERQDNWELKIGGNHFMFFNYEAIKNFIELYDKTYINLIDIWYMSTFLRNSQTNNVKIENVTIQEDGTFSEEKQLKRAIKIHKFLNRRNLSEIKTANSAMS